ARARAAAIAATALGFSTLICSSCRTISGLPQGFCEGLHEEDDWSLIIKLHALFEAVVTHLLVAHLGQEALRNVFDKVEMSKSDTGKVAFAGALNLIDADQRKFVSTLSSIRNKLVHNVRNVTFDLRAHVDSLDHNQRTHFVNAAGYAFDKNEKLANAVL